MKRSSLYLSFLILIIPLITFITSILLRLASGPFWQYGDPPYNYLFNAYLLVKGHCPMDTTHPGTPLQVLMAIIIWIFNLGRPASEAVNHALINPEFYLWAVYLFLLMSSFLTSVFLAAYVYRKTNDKLAALLTQWPQLFFLILPAIDTGNFPMLPLAADINAEVLFIVIMNLFNLCILGLYFSKEKSKELTFIILLAVICGLGMALKVYFFIIMFWIFMLIPHRQKALFVIIGVISFVFCTIPIISKYPQLLGMIIDMADHSSKYGWGPKNFVDWNSFAMNIHLMLRFDWFFIYSALGAWIWSSIHIIKDRQDRKACFVWGLSCCCLVFIAAVAKHFASRYLAPSFCLLGSIFPLIYLTEKARYKLFKPLTLAFILIFACTCILSAIPYYKKLLTFTHDIHQFYDKVTANYPACTIIPSTTGDIDFFINEQESMHRANGTAFRVEGDDLFRLYPNSYYFFSEEVTSPLNNESYGIWNYKQRVLGDDIINSCPCAIFIKYVSDFSAYPYQVHLIDQSKYLNAYLLINSTEKQANDLFSQSMESFKKGDYQQALVLGVQSRQLNYEPQGQLDYMLMIIYHDLLKSRGAQ